MQLNELQLWATLIYAVSALIFFLILLLISYQIVRRLLRLLFGANSIFGSDGRVKLVTLGASALLFSEVLPALFIALVSTISALFLNTPVSLLNSWRTNIGFCGNDKQFECMAALSAGFVQAFTQSLGYAFDKISNIPVHRTLLLFATWAVLSLIVSQAQQAEAETPGSSRIKSWFRAGYANSGTPAFANVMFFLILAVGAYLSTAAIAAIPGLQEKSAVFQEVGPEKLKSQLDEALAAFDRYPSEIGTKDPLASLRSHLATARADKSETANSAAASAENNKTPGASPTPTPSPTASQSANNNSAAGQPVSDANVISTPSPVTTVTNPLVSKDLSEGRLSTLERLVSGWTNERESVLQAYSSLLDSVKVQQKSAKNIAVRSYEVGNLDRKGNKERVQYFLALSDWFNQRSAEADQQLNNCLKYIQGLDSSLQTWADTVPGFAKNDMSDETFFIGLESAARFFRGASDGCPQAIPLDPNPPRRPQLGDSSYLGPFGFVASWLLRTESLPLALITGLLGFGLLGSACSTFVREQLDQRREAAAVARATGANTAQARRLAVPAGDGRMVHDLTGVIIRGLLAAVVVFLAVEGGLAIFASGGGEPNPYVLLLTCLIAAVFSEQVWRWAEKELADKFGSGETPDDDNAEVNTDEEEHGQEEEDEEQVEEADATISASEEGDVSENVGKASSEPPDTVSQPESHNENDPT
jgi:hypothetical protein